MLGGVTKQYVGKLVRQGRLERGPEGGVTVASVQAHRDQQRRSSLITPSRQLSRAVGVEPPGEDVTHTALGNSRWVRDVLNAVAKSGS